MSDYITLLGAEQVKSAASQMADAADEMRRAANTINESIDRLLRALDDHVTRIEAAARGDV